MTFEELKTEVARYRFDQDAELVVSHDWPHTLRGASITLRYPRKHVDTLAPDRLCTTVTVKLRWWLTRRKVRKLVENCWKGLWEHELEEWLTKDGVHLYDPHGVRE
ncbi:MAG: hypothetical protein V3S71_06525 [Acidobacteriota bacterium]